MDCAPSRARFAGRHQLVHVSWRYSCTALDEEGLLVIPGIEKPRVSSLRILDLEVAYQVPKMYPSLSRYSYGTNMGPDKDERK
jgi:hypothetical protein